MATSPSTMQMTGSETLVTWRWSQRCSGMELCLIMMTLVLWERATWSTNSQRKRKSPFLQPRTPLPWMLRSMMTVSVVSEFKTSCLEDCLRADLCLMILFLEATPVFEFHQVREPVLMTKRTSPALQVPSTATDPDLQPQQSPTWRTTCLCKETTFRNHLHSSMKLQPSPQLQNRLLPQLQPRWLTQLLFSTMKMKALPSLQLKLVL